MAKTVTEKIKLWGIVQGVGFRPFVAKIADSMSMKGNVLNIGGLVEITVTDDTDRITEFIERIKAEKPGPAEIVHIRREVIDRRDFERFEIIKSGEGDDEVAMIPADLAVCPSCLEELYDRGDHRYRHPFISCMICGPRYTIIDRIPYDRDNTAMIDWPMCDRCESEYTSLEDRRYHAQTVSCHDCGPYLIFRDRDGNVCDREDALKRAAEMLKAGGVIGFKGMGGYNLMADPLNTEAVKRLREIKDREQKPFAVMFRSVEQIREYSAVNETEENLLKSSARPILLLEHHSEEKMAEAAGCISSGKASTVGDAEPSGKASTAGDAEPSGTKSQDTKSVEELLKSRFIGSFLPSMGGQYLLLDEFGGPLIATSANVSGMPIIIEDAQMFQLMQDRDLIGGVLYNERDIRVRVDDSVVRVIDEQPQIIRRSKGYAPVPLYIESACGKENMIFAAGGQLKNSFALTKGSFSYVSQYFGDLDSDENRRIYADNVKRMSQLFRIRPTLAVADLHPLYNSTVFAEEYAQAAGIELIKVQHHHAHVASVMAEHNIAGKVIGVSMDGTGYGTDGKIWGGEILLCENEKMERIRHLKYVQTIGGDVSIKEGWKTALCYKYALETGEYGAAAEDEIAPDMEKYINFGRRHGHFREEEKIVKSALKHNINTIMSSSMGRLFDAVSSMLGICHENTYEGRCAITLEDAAARAKKKPGANEADDLALDFHMQIAGLISDNCLRIREERGVSQVVLTGGVFQNHILMDETLALLRGAGFNVFYNISVSPNDGGIALGQSYIAMKYLESKNSNADHLGC